MRASPTSPRMFENDLIDFMSRSPWWIVPLFWLPVSAMLFHYGWQVAHANSTFFAACVAGALMWTLTEYALHRFVFHWKPNSALGRKFHYISHGIHHDLPNDRYRLVLPLGLSIVLSVFFGTAFYQCLGIQIFFPFFGGYLVGYTIYDVMHYAVHHVKFKHPVLKRLKRHHLLHHHDERYANRNFGVSSTLWDHVFGTY